jgi:hypothetical protein
MTAWFGRGRAALFDAVASVCDEIEANLKTGIGGIVLMGREVAD